MNHQVDVDFQRQLDQFNDSQGGPSRVAVCWDDQKQRWIVWIVPVNDSAHPMARNDMTKKLLRPLPDESGRWGVRLFTWQGADGRFLPLDGRLFQSLLWADSFRDKQHFENTIEAPEAKKDLAARQQARDLAYAAKNYWWSHDKLSVGRHVNSGWRWRNR